MTPDRVADGLGNHSILERNTLFGFSESAGFLYLKLLDVFQGDERRAFLAADDYERSVAGALDHILRNAPTLNLTTKVRTNLAQFFAERWRHNFLPTRAILESR